MKLWHDDERPPPDDTWTVARTNAEALAALETGTVTEAELDYVLRFPENGMELVIEMAERGLIPPIVNIHSASWRGANEMAETLRAAGSHVVTTEAEPV